MSFCQLAADAAAARRGSSPNWAELGECGAAAEETAPATAYVTGRPLDELIERGVKGFTRELVDGTDANLEELDALIERYAEGWTVATRRAPRPP